MNAEGEKDIQWISGSQRPDTNRKLAIRSIVFSFY
jgi:hypothetical protein